MSEIIEQQGQNSLLIVEENDIPKFGGDSGCIDLNCERLDFTSSDNTDDEIPSAEQNLLKIIEKKDLVMSDRSLQVDNADEDCMTSSHEAINRAVVRMSSLSSDFEESENFDGRDQCEAINRSIDRSSRKNSESHMEDGEGIVDILGQINEIVGFICFFVQRFRETVRTVIYKSFCQ